MNKYTLVFLGAFFSLSLFAENQQTPKTMAILPTTDLSGYNLAEPLQYALGQLYQSTGLFQAQLSANSLNGFTAREISQTLQTVQTEALTFAYMEKQRISVFFFDHLRPNEFIVAYRLLTNPPGGQLTSEYVEKNFRECVGEIVESYRSSRYQPLPGNGSGTGNEQENRWKADEARKLFREMASLEEKNWYLGANVGMARFSQNSTSASTVNFGGYAGARLGERFSGELGVDLFSYALLHGDIRYSLPIAEKYINLSVAAGIARFMGSLTENQGFAGQRINKGQMGFGPGLGFDIPLLGATLRGDIRLYAGSATVFLGSYGIIINL